RSLSSSQGARGLFAPSKLNSVPGRMATLHARVPLPSRDVLAKRSEDLFRPSSQCIDLELATSPFAMERPVACQVLLRKEVIQPHLPVRLPCYDFTPIADPTFDGSLQKVGPPASGVTNFRGVTGGVYKARERIHPDVADSGLLATPTSWSRVADSNPN